MSMYHLLSLPLYFSQLCVLLYPCCFFFFCVCCFSSFPAFVISLQSVFLDASFWTRVHRSVNSLQYLWGQANTRSQISGLIPWWVSQPSPRSSLLSHSKSLPLFKRHYHYFRLQMIPYAVCQSLPQGAVARLRWCWWNFSLGLGRSFSRSRCCSKVWERKLVDNFVWRWYSSRGILHCVERRCKRVSAECQGVPPRHSERWSVWITTPA